MNPVLLVIFLGTASSNSAPVEAQRPVATLVQKSAEEYIDGLPHSVVIGISTPRGRQVWGFGTVEHNGSRQTPDGKTIYEIGSITKTFTGTVLANLALANQVTLDDPVSKHLPADWTMPTRDNRTISLLHLATHTSSLPRMPPGMGPFLVLTGTVNDPYSNYQSENLQLTLSRVQLDRPIGSRFEYSNLGAGLLGVTLAQAVGEKDSADLFDKRILKPLALRDTTFTLSDEQQQRLAMPYDSDGNAAHNWHFASLKACGGLRSNVDDMLTYAEAAMGSRDSDLHPAFELAMQPWRQTCEGDRYIGLGWFIQPLNFAIDNQRTTTTLVWHNGATGGYRSFLGLVPEHDIAIVALANSTRPVDPPLSLPILKAVLQQEAAVATVSE